MRAATAAHPLCTCRVHEHGDCTLVTVHASGCAACECGLFRGALVPASRKACPVHGGQR